MLLIGKPAGLRDIRQSERMIAKQNFCAAYSGTKNILMRRHACRRLEQPNEMGGADTAEIRQDLQLDVCSQVRRDEIPDFSKMPPAQPPC